MRIVVADDEAMIRAGVRAILASDPDIEVVAEAADGREAVEMVRAHRPDLALLDIRMPKLDGLAAAAEIRRLAPEVGVIMLTTFGEDEYIAGALGNGAGGFLLKSGDPRELIAGIRAVAEGAAFLSPQVARRVINELARGGGRMSRAAEARQRIAGLTGRERQVLELLAGGLSNAEIASRLHVVEGTVKAYVSGILTRLAVRNRVQAAIMAYEAGVVDGLA
ncbi:LuxR family two component transcriptional regulator [Stackebrandtia albiflava]|uniref:LuxR family two component transcriptional regulator n=2 Tax=Stackebrandtia albiflava TaxID=406432 RepID=A0A562UQB0_9ACTN|nr:response regulator transcription factor [Stackebrandtia albiflava]TWJ07815.1 LuxR family two component transcriptional regulator [Stackebrandtia albiflava]